MAIKSARWARDDLERFPRDGNRYEVLDGQLFVTPQATPDHQIMALRLTIEIHNYCWAHGVGVAVGPGAVIFGENELQPDIEVLPAGGYQPRKKWADFPHPILAVEVLSPFNASRRRDLDAKRKAYLKLGIPEYWVVDHEARHVHVWSGRRAEKIVTDVLRWNPDPAIVPFELPLHELFGPLAG
jgi:Uma2 family endonuclease